MTDECYCYVDECRDIEDEKMWIDEKMTIARSTEFGETLQEVLRLKKKHQVIMPSVCFRKVES